MMFFKNFIKKFASQYSKLQLYEIILKKRISFWRKNDYMMNKCLRLSQTLSLGNCLFSSPLPDGGNLIVVVIQISNKYPFFDEEF